MIPLFANQQGKAYLIDLFGRRPLFRADILSENAPHFFDRFGMALRRVTGAHNFLGLDAFDVRAFVSDDPVSLAGNRSLAKHGDNRVGRYAGINRCA